MEDSKVLKSVAVVLCLDVPIPFDASDGKAVDLLIFLLVPTNSSKDHLEILAEVANMLSDNKFIDGLRYPTSDQLYEEICSWYKLIRRLQIRCNATCK